MLSYYKIGYGYSTIKSNHLSKEFCKIISLKRECFHQKIKRHLSTTRDMDKGFQFISKDGKGN